MKKKSPSLEQALEFLQRELKKKRFPLLPSLPAVEKLACEARVAAETMRKAVKILKGSFTADSHAEEISVSNFIRKCSQASAQPLAYHGGWQDARDRIADDIFAGTWAPGQRLPSAKILTHRYGIAYLTLRKALNALLKKGIIASFKRGYVVPRILPGKSQLRIVLICPDVKVPGHLSHAASPFPIVINHIESYCSSNQILFTLVKLDISENEPAFYEPQTGWYQDISDDPAVCGYVYIITWPKSFHKGIIERLTSFGKPVAALAISGGWSLPQSAFRKKYLKVFDLGISSRCGYIMARYLHARGYRKAAFISAAGATEWSQNRLEGVREGFRDMGRPDAVSAFIIDMHTKNASFEKENKNIALLLKLKSLINHNIPEAFNIKSLNLSPLLKDNINSENIRSRLSPLFEKALRDNSISAWIAANDFFAMFSREFLKKRKSRRAHPIALASFDNSHFALEYSFTSYDFNPHAVANAMLAHIMQTPHNKLQEKKDIIIIDGLVIERESTLQLKKH